MTLPIESYEFTDEESQVIGQARRELIRRCMERFGFDYVPPAPPALPASTLTRTSRRYGLSDAAQAARWGFHLPPDQAPNVKGYVPPQPTAAEQLVLTGGEGPVNDSDLLSGAGSGQQYNGLEMPKGGCQGEATAMLLASGGHRTEPELVQRLNHEPYARATDDPRVRAALAEWSRCMEVKGYDYASPLDVESFTSSPEPTRREIETATSSVECSEQSRLIQIWYTTEVEFQQAFIEQNAEAFRDIREGMDAEVRIAASIVAEVNG